MVSREHLVYVSDQDSPDQVNKLSSLHTPATFIWKAFPALNWCPILRASQCACLVSPANIAIDNIAHIVQCPSFPVSMRPPSGIGFPSVSGGRSHHAAMDVGQEDGAGDRLCRPAERNSHLQPTAQVRLSISHDLYPGPVGGRDVNTLARPRSTGLLSSDVIIRAPRLPLGDVCSSDTRLALTHARRRHAIAAARGG